MSGSGSIRASMFRSDRPRPIDCYIDFFGSALPLLAGLSVAGCAGLTQISDQGGLVARVLSPSTASGGPARAVEQTKPPFTDRARDQFFSLAWRAENARVGIRVTGLLDNRDGPEVIDVTLRISLWTAAETPLAERLVTLDGIVEKKAVRSFVVTVPTAAAPSRISVSVYAFRFPQPGGSK